MNWPLGRSGPPSAFLSWFSLATADQPITKALEHTAALAGKSVATATANSNPYFRETVDACGRRLLGAYAGSKLSNDRAAAAVPRLWSERFGPSAPKRFAGAFAGGVLIMLGARIAGGCTSGHGISMTGVLFGFLPQKGRVAKFEVIAMSGGTPSGALSRARCGTGGTSRSRRSRKHRRGHEWRARDRRVLFPYLLHRRERTW